MIDDSLILKVHGFDAGSFLLRQFRGNTDVLMQGQWVHTACCDGEERVLAYLWAFPWNDGILLRLPRSVAPAFLAHITPQIGHSEVRIDATTLCFGALAGNNPERRAVLYYGDGATCYIGGIPDVIPFISEQPLPNALPAEMWQAARIRAGIPEIYADTAGCFRPFVLGIGMAGMHPDKNDVHRRLATASIEKFRTGRRALHHKHTPAGTILDYGYDAQGCIIQAVVEERFLGKALTVCDSGQPLIFR